MTLIESYGTGIGKIQRAYKEERFKPLFETARGVFRVTLPNRNEPSPAFASPDPENKNYMTQKGALDNQKQLILDFTRENGKITRKEVEDLLHSGTTKSFRLLRELCEEGELESQGSGKRSYYIIR